MEIRVEIAGVLKGSLCAYAREYLASGGERSDYLVGCRDGKPALHGSIGWFADHTVREHRTQGPTFIPWKAFSPFDVASENGIQGGGR